MRRVAVVIVCILCALFFYAVLLAQSHPRQLISTGHDMEAFWSPDGEKISFLTARETYNPEVAANTLELWVMNRDGSNQRPLISRTDKTFSAHHWQVKHVSWFPDSQSLLCSLSSSGGIWRVFLDGRKTRLTPPDEESAHAPVLAPNGKRIAFLVQVGENPGTGSPLYRLYTADADGTGRIIVEEGLIGEYCWTNDSRSLVYTLFDFREKNFDLWEKGQDGSHSRRISKTPTDEESPGLSPDGKTIAFITGQDLYLTPPDSFRPTRIFSGVRTVEWIPGRDLLLILHEAKQGESAWSEPWIINLDGKLVKKVVEKEFSRAWFAPNGDDYVYSRRENLYLDPLDARGGK